MTDSLRGVTGGAGFSVAAGGNHPGYRAAQEAGRYARLMASEHAEVTAAALRRLGKFLDKGALNRDAPRGYHLDIRV